MQRNTITYAAAVGACKKGGQWLHAVDFLAQLACGPMKQDIMTCNAAVRAGERGAQVSVVGTRGAEHHYNVAVSACKNYCRYYRQ